MYLFCATENDLRPRSEGVKCTVMILTIIIVAIMAVTFLCTHYTSGLSDISESTTIYRHRDHFDNDRYDLSEKLIATVIDFNESVTSANRGQPRIAPTESVSDTASDQLLSKFRLARTDKSGSRLWPFVRQGRFTANNIYPVDSDREYVAAHPAELWDINRRSNRYNYQNMKSDEWGGHHASYDLTNSLDHNDAFKHADNNLFDGIGLRPHYSFDNGAYYKPIAEISSTMHYRPPLRPHPIYPILSPQTKPAILKKKNFDWQTIGLLALVKLGLIKLKLFGILKILFLLLFKLKLFLIAIFIKFHLVLKYSKLFQTLFLPLLILPLFLTLITVILPTIISAIYLLPGQPLNMMSTAPTSSLSNLLSSILSNLPGIPGTPAQPGLIKSFKSNQFSNIPKNILNSRSGTFRLNDLSFHNMRYPEILEKIDTALSIFLKLLDSEKCVERIVCQIAAVGKEGITIDMIYRLLNNILTMFIAILKRKTHVKTYGYGNNDIPINFSTPESWTTWCMEHYEYNRTIISNTTKTGL